MTLRLLSLLVALLAVFCLMGCSAKKIIGRNCEKAGNAELYVCDPL